MRVTGQKWLETRVGAACLWFGLGLVSGMNTGQNAEDAEVTQKSQKGCRKIPLYGGVRRRRGVVGRLLLRWFCSNYRRKPPRQAAPATPP